MSQSDKIMLLQVQNMFSGLIWTKTLNGMQNRIPSTATENCRLDPSRYRAGHPISSEMHRLFEAVGGVVGILMGEGPL